MGLTWNEKVLPKADMMQLGDKDIALIVNGDRRQFANDQCQAAQMECEGQLSAAVKKKGYRLVRAHLEEDPDLRHGFIQTQAQGRDVLAKIPKNARIAVAEAVWQFSNHVAYSLWEHAGPILIASNFDGTWPGLVGAAGLEACLTKHKYQKNQKGHSLLWSSEKFGDDFSGKNLDQWLSPAGKIKYKMAHVIDFLPENHKEYAKAINFGKKAAGAFQNVPRIIGIYDPLCMGMLNAAFDERDMVGTGIQIRRLNQSELYARMQEISPREAEGYMKYLVDRGFTLEGSPLNLTGITQKAVIETGQGYGAAVKHLAEERLDGIGIAYQLGLAKICCASDGWESMMNSSDRPPVEFRGKLVMPGEPIMCANEADMGCAIDQTMTKILYKATGLAPKWWETTQHDLRWGDTYQGEATYKTSDGQSYDLTLDSFVWAFELSGNTPAGHMENGWADMEGVRQPYNYFTENGICTRGVAKAGELIWSRVYIEEGEKCIDIGRGAAVKLPEEESQRRLDATTKEWPIMHAITYGVTRDGMMAKHKSNHITVSYSPTAETANELLMAKAGMFQEAGYKVKICGSIKLEDSIEYKVKHGAKEFKGPAMKYAA